MGLPRMRHLHKLELLLQRKPEHGPASQEHQHKPSPKDTILLPLAGKHLAGLIPTHDLKSFCSFCTSCCSPPEKMPFLPPVPWLHPAPQVPAGRSKGDREIICQPLATQPGDSVPTPGLLQGIITPGITRTPAVPVLPVPALVGSGSSRQMSPAIRPHE